MIAFKPAQNSVQFPINMSSDGSIEFLHVQLKYLLEGKVRKPGYMFLNFPRQTRKLRYIQGGGEPWSNLKITEENISIWW